MEQDTTVGLALPATRDVLTEVLRGSARRLLAEAVEAEVAAYIAEHAEQRDGRGHRLVVRNGHLPQRAIQTSLGPVEVRQPRINDQRVDDQGQRLRFTSAILPPYLRRTRTLADLVPWLYLKGVSTGQLGEALTVLLGQPPANLSASTVARMNEVWRREWQSWSERSLVGKRYVYLWADGVHFNIRLESPENNRLCILVILGATATGEKELLAISDGYRESEQGWLDVLRDLKHRGLTAAPELAIGDGALGFWKALPQVYPTTREQRCWVHKMANVLNKLPQLQQPQAKKELQSIWMAATEAQAETAFDAFVDRYAAKYPKASECLAKDRRELLAFYDFPAEHWVHIRTTNPIESTFATVRLRTHKTKGSGSRQACLTMVFKLCQLAQRRWKRLKGSELIADVIKGVRFVNGIKEAAA
jgi:transposase-like protein